MDMMAAKAPNRTAHEHETLNPERGVRKVKNMRGGLHVQTAPA